HRGHQGHRGPARQPALERRDARLERASRARCAPRGDRELRVQRGLPSPYAFRVTRDLADVYVLDEHRGRGLGVELVREIVENGPFAGRRWVLHTRDAHALYEKLGFGPNERLMERPQPD